MEGWIKLHRKLITWEWYTDSQMVHLFIHLIISANHEAKSWRGINIERGQIVTGRTELSSQTGISEQSIRTCLNRLKSTSEITIKSTNKYSIITICEYDSYQLNEKQINQQINQQTNQQLTSNQPATNHKQEYKELKELNKYNNNLNINSQIFENFRLKYPGSKRGLKTEFDNFRKKHKDWADVLPLLLPNLETQIRLKSEKKKKGLFVPDWKMLQTYINQRSWEEEIPPQLEAEEVTNKSPLKIYR